MNRIFLIFLIFIGLSPKSYSQHNKWEYKGSASLKFDREEINEFTIDGSCDEFTFERWEYQDEFYDNANNYQDV